MSDPIDHDIHRLSVACSDLIEAYRDPARRRLVEAERSRILWPLTELTDVLMADDRAEVRRLAAMKRWRQPNEARP